MMDAVEAVIALATVVAISVLLAMGYYDSKFKEAIAEPCVSRCDKKWVAVDITPDWKGSSCRCATQTPEAPQK